MSIEDSSWISVLVLLALGVDIALGIETCSDGDFRPLPEYLIISHTADNLLNVSVVLTGCSNGLCGGVCRKEFEDVDATVACTNLFYKQSVARAEVASNQVNDYRGPIVIQDVNYTGVERQPSEHIASSELNLVCLNSSSTVRINCYINDTGSGSATGADTNTDLVKNLKKSQDFVEVEAMDKGMAYFSYHDGNGSGLIYISTATKFSLTDFRGREIVLVLEVSEEQRIVRIFNDYFLQYEVKGRYVDYYIPFHLIDGAAYVSKLNKSAVEHLQTLPSNYHFTKLKESYERLLSTAAAKSIIKSAIILGENLNYTGIEYPLLLPLYVIAYSLHEEVKESEAGHSHFSCMKWVCGNCYYHVVHSLCCQENVIKTKCLFPLNFKCN